MNYNRVDETTEWLNYLQPEGLVVGANVLREKELSPVRQTPLDTDEARDALGLPADASLEEDRHFVLGNVWPFFERVLGWPVKLVSGSPNGPQLAAELARTVPEHATLLSPDMAILWNDAAEEGVPAQALVLLHPALDPDKREQFGPSEWEASPHQRLERLLRESGVGVGILVARNTLRLIHAPRGETTGWMSWPLAALGRVEGRPMLAGLKLCLGRNAFFTGAPETRLRRLLQASRESQNEVSEKLSGQVLGALHELLRGLHRAAPDRIEALADEDPHHLYEGLLTCLMRLVFLLYAEDRDLLPSSSETQLKQLWESGYSIKTLYARLLVDEALNPDTMDERRGGWGQLLAVSRLIHDGYGDWIARRGGKLFDPDVFPFLEGRDNGSARADSQVLPVSDGTILRVLHGLMTVDGRSLSGEKMRERLSYRSLDVESIGSVYETVMGFTAKRATEQMVALRDEKKLPVFLGLDSLIAQKPASRRKWLKKQAIKLSAKQSKGVGEAKDVPALLDALSGAIDHRASTDGTPIVAGSPYLQPTEERRRSGSHYTPRTLTEPIVRHALEPVFEQIGMSASPEAVLALKVLDPACGSGAFLVEACRQLGFRLEQAWDMHKAEKPTIPQDEDDATHARRLVAQRCLYGVDRNPMAVDLARLSLWLVTLAREHEFSFLDHALKSGDSLVGLMQRQISAANWDVSKPGLPLFRGMIEKVLTKALEGREAIRAASDDVLRAVQESRFRRVEDVVRPARIVGDAVIAAFFASEKAKAREIERARVESFITGEINPKWELLEQKARMLHLAQGWQPFHWEIEFPEVFFRDKPGFDTIVGNPPFLGGSLLSAAEGKIYVAWLLSAFEPAHGKSDLVAFFLRRSFGLLREGGAMGLIATKTVRQGFTRFTSLETIINSSGEIFRAVRRFKWPGDAAVIVAILHIIKGPAQKCMLEGRAVSHITSFLLPFGPNSRPEQLSRNANIVFSGVNPNGAGFVFEPADRDELLMRCTECAGVLRPYLSSDDLNGNPYSAPSRFIADVGSLSEEQLQLLPDLYTHLEQTVRQERKQNSDKRLREQWWKFSRPAAELNQRIHEYKRVLVMGRLAAHHTFAYQDNGTVFSDALSVFLLSGFAGFAVLQSRVHEVWAKFLGSSFKDDPRYIPEDCFETFPFPENFESDGALEKVAKEYYDYRSELMVASEEGMTTTYNRFHDADECEPAIIHLRKLHDAMDCAVLRAYGWSDLVETVRPTFLTPSMEDDHTFQSRYFWPTDQRDLVLSRLLLLHAERHKEEVSAGVAPAPGAWRVKNEDGEGQDSFDLD